MPSFIHLSRVNHSQWGPLALPMQDGNTIPESNQYACQYQRTTQSPASSCCPWTYRHTTCPLDKLRRQGACGDANTWHATSSALFPRRDCVRASYLTVNCK